MSIKHQTQFQQRPYQIDLSQFEFLIDLVKIKGWLEQNQTFSNGSFIRINHQLIELGRIH